MTYLYRTTLIWTIIATLVRGVIRESPDTNAEFVKDDLPEHKVDDPGDVLETTADKPKPEKVEKMKEITDDLPELENKGADFSVMVGSEAVPPKPKEPEPKFAIRDYSIDAKEVTKYFRRPTCSGAVPVKAEAVKVLSDPGQAFDDLEEEANGPPDQSPAAAKAEKELEKSPAMKEAKAIAENPIQEDPAVDKVEAPGVSTPEPAQAVPTEMPADEEAEKEPEPVKLDVNRETGGDIFNAALQHAKSARMNIKEREKVDSEAHRERLIKRVQDIREGKLKEHVDNVEEAATIEKPPTSETSSESLLERSSSSPGEAQEAAAASEEKAIEGEKEKPCEEGYDSTSREEYHPCPYRPIWEDPTAEKMKNGEPATSGAAAASSPESEVSTPSTSEGGEGSTTADTPAATVVEGSAAAAAAALPVKTSFLRHSGHKTESVEVERPVELTEEEPLNTEYEPNYQALDMGATWNKDQPLLEPQGGDFESLTNKVNRPRELKPTEPKFHAYRPEWDEKQFPVKLDSSKYVTGKVPVQQTTQGLFDSPEVDDLRQQLQTSDDALVAEAKKELGCDHGQSIQAIREVSQSPVNTDDVIQSIEASENFEPEAPAPVEAEGGGVVQQTAPKATKVQLDISHRTSGSELWDEVGRYATKLPEEPAPPVDKVAEVAQAAQAVGAVTAPSENESFLAIKNKSGQLRSKQSVGETPPQTRKKNCDPHAYTKDKPYSPCYVPDWVDPKMPETRH
ncbi:hypothetical protein FOL47_006921 [Perkinsus chesapeaki]|uniref:Uncharacterized protein n=1 Tax=Perkinsus chesapeaki TaxID=330153 RepID=A0A7J6LNK0_PERCH|nr:hypothetical protein FOL47_006921 [Perkinsus chesapeaki]